MEPIIRDLRDAVRFLTRRPLFSLVAIASLAIGIGASTTIFTVIQRLILLPPPGVEDPDRVVEIGRTTGRGGFDTFSYVELEAFRNGPQADSLGDQVSCGRVDPGARRETARSGNGMDGQGT